MTIGETYKSIRQNKNLTQKEICQDEVTTVTLSKFENGKSLPNCLLLKYFLDRINMSFEEFEFLCNQDEYDDSQAIKTSFESITSNVEEKNIENLLKELEDYLDHNQNKNIKEIKDILVMSQDIEKHGFSKNAHQIGLKFWNNIVGKKEWYLDDLRMLNFILFYFPSDKVFDIVDRILERLKEYNGLDGELKILKTSILINLSTIYMQDGKFEECAEIISGAYKDAKRLKRYDFLAVCLIRQGILEQNKEKILDGKNLLEIAKEPDLQREIQYEIDEFYERAQKVGK